MSAFAEKFELRVECGPDGHFRGVWKCRCCPENGRADVRAATKEIAIGTLETDAGLLLHLKTKEGQKDHSTELVDE